MTITILNSDDVFLFLDRLKTRHPQMEQFIMTQVRAYVFKKERTFLIKDDNYGISLWIKKTFNQLSYSESKIFDNHGIWGKYYRFNFNEECFQKYAKLLDFATEFPLKKLNNTSLDTLIKKYFKRPILKRIKIKDLSQGKDFKYIKKINNFYLIELLSSDAFLKEGSAMHNCLGTHYTKPDPKHKFFSLRNLNNKPIMNIQVDTNKKNIIEAKGFANSAPDSVLLDKVCSELGCRIYLRSFAFRGFESDSIIDFIGYLVWFCLFFFPSIAIIFFCILYF